MATVATVYSTAEHRRTAKQITGLEPREGKPPRVGNKRGWASLEQVLAEAMPPELVIWAVYSRNRHLSAKVRVFVDFLRKRFDPGCDRDRPAVVPLVAAG
jgi:hypothetical protein